MGGLLKALWALFGPIVTDLLKLVLTDAVFKKKTVVTERTDYARTTPAGRFGGAADLLDRVDGGV